MSFLLLQIKYMNDIIYLSATDSAQLHQSSLRHHFHQSSLQNQLFVHTVTVFYLQTVINMSSILTVASTDNDVQILEINKQYPLFMQQVSNEILDQRL